MADTNLNTEHSILPPPSPTPGSVWWCDGVALSFEAKFKRRPVLVIEVRLGEDGGEDAAQFVVVPLSSSRRYGQEPAVTHEGGVSYMTGETAVVPRAALLKSLGTWNGTISYGKKEKALSSAKPYLIAQLRGWLRRRIG